MNRSALVLLIAVVAAFCLLPVMSDDDSDAVGSAVIGGTSYPSVEDALNASKSGDVVYVVPEAVTDGSTTTLNASLSSDATVKKGVTLVVPYSEVRNPTGTADGDSNATAKIAGNDHRYMVFTIDSKATLTVQGDFIVGGILSKFFTFDYQGHTSGKFARLWLAGSIVVADGGVLHCYGSIMGGGTISLQDGAELYEPFVVTDYVGGDLVYVSWEKGQSFFNRYAFPNIQTKLTMTSGATVYGMINLYANKTYNKTVEPIVSDSEGFIILDKGSTLTATYSSKANLTAYVGDQTQSQKDAAWASNIYPDIGKKIIRISGGASFGSICPEVQGRSANSADTIFSVPYNFDITLMDGTYTIGNDLRFLPGSRLAVDKTATLDVDAKLLMYDGLVSKEFKDKYYPTTAILDYRSEYFSNIAVLVVNGTMNINGTFTGLIQGTSAGGTVNVGSKAVLSLDDQPFGAKGSFNGGAILDNVSYMDLRAFAMDAYGKKVDLVAGKTYTSTNASKHTLDSFSCTDPATGKTITVDLDQAVTGSWYSGTLSVKYSLNGGTGTVPTDLNRYEPGATVVVLGQNGITKSGAQFSGWCTNAAGTGTTYSPNQTFKIASNTTLYAKWTVPVSGITLDKSEASLEKGETLTLKATVTPTGADTTVKWSTSNAKVATVNNGKVAAVSAGTATITATTTDGGYKASCKVTVTGSIEVTGVALDKTSAAMEVGDSLTLKATVSPSNATDKTVVWTTSSSKVATVDGGVVKAVSVGTATITATTADGGHKATCKVTVSVPTIKVTGVDLASSKETIGEGNTIVLAYEISPGNATDQSVTWTSSNTKVATVSNGVVKGISAGTATITITTTDGSYKDTCEITVRSAVIEVTGISLNVHDVTIEEGAYAALVATVTPSNATTKSVVWYSMDMSVATVGNDGKVYGVAPGTTTVKVSTADGKFVDECKVTVTEIDTPVDSVSVTPSSASINIGDTKEFTFEVSPSGAEWSTVAWTSSDPSIASVVDGKVTGLSEGEVTITVSVDGVKGTSTLSVIDPDVPVTGVSLDTSEASVKIGESVVLEATITPSDATDKVVYWTTNDSNIATVSDGKVTGVSEGVATITVLTSDGGYSAICTVSVIDDEVKVTGVTLDKEYASFAIGETLTLTATVEPSDATDKDVFWTTSNSSIALVEDGVVTGVITGSAVITVTTEDGSFSAQCKVDVLPAVVHVTSITLDKTKLVMDSGDSASLKATVLPAEASNRAVVWTTSDKTVATVSDGVVKAINAGTATITATTEDGGLAATCAVTVETPSSGGDNSALIYAVIGIVAIMGVLAFALIFKRKTA